MPAPEGAEVKGDEAMRLLGDEAGDTLYDTAYAPAYEEDTPRPKEREGDNVITPPSPAEGPAKVALVYAAPPE